MNETSVAIIIAEGGSEKTFLSSLIQTQYGFESLTGKNSICFRNPKNSLQMWFFPIPALGKTHAGGNSELLKKEPYIKADTVLCSHMHLLSPHPKNHYLILTDTDGIPSDKIKEKEDQITNSFQSVGIIPESFEVHFPNREIEVWLMAGLNESFSDFGRNGWQKLKAQENTLENLLNPKEFLDDLLDPNLAGNRMAIGSRIGSNFDIDRARRLSPSFNKFISSLEQKKLL